MKELTVPGVLSSLKDVRNYVAEAADQAGLDKKASYRLLLAIDELATNSIVHGYEEANLNGNLYLLATIDDKALTIFVEDTGNEYNLLDWETPTISTMRSRIGPLAVWVLTSRSKASINSSTSASEITIGIPWSSTVIMPRREIA